jgi:hypothetical protein
MRPRRRRTHRERPDNRRRRPRRRTTYVLKKTAEGHSKLKIVRCLKRYLAREIYYQLNPG